MAASIHIEGSSRMSREEVRTAHSAEPFHSEDAAAVMTRRSTLSILREWAAHKLLYQLGLFITHTESVDLDTPQPFLARAAYFIVGGAALPFYR